MTLKRLLKYVKSNFYTIKSNSYPLTKFPKMKLSNSIFFSNKPLLLLPERHSELGRKSILPHWLPQSASSYTGRHRYNKVSRTYLVLFLFQRDEIEPGHHGYARRAADRTLPMPRHRRCGADAPGESGESPSGRC